MDDDAIYLLTTDGAHRVVPGHTPQEIPLELSYGATLTNRSFLFWSKQAIWEAPKRGGGPRRIATLLHQPQYFVSSGEESAWVDRSEAGQFTIQTLDGRRPRVIYSSLGRIDAATMVDDWVFFVERPMDDSWRLGRVRVTGGIPAFTAQKAGNQPAMIAAWRDDIYYYDINASDLRRLSPDFHREETLAKNFICSPLAVWERVYCSQVGGLFQIFGEARPPRLLTNNGHALITRIAANATRVAWVSDTGANQLVVQMLPVIPER